MERTFSSYGNIHTAKRNRLTNDRAGKLVYINHNLRLLKKNIENKPTMIQSVSSVLSNLLPLNIDDNISDCLLESRPNKRIKI